MIGSVNCSPDRPDYWRAAPVEDSCPYVLDFDGNGAPKEVLHAPASGDLQDGFLRHLNSSPSPAATSVVLLCYPWVNSLNVQYIGALGSTLGLDPCFFITHFQDHHRGRLVKYRRPPSRLHLDTSVLHFWFQDDCTVQNVVTSAITSGKTFIAL